MRGTRVLSYLLILLGANGLQSAESIAQSRTFECLPKEALPASRAAEVLAGTQQAYGKVGSLTSHFTQESYLASLEISEMSEGEMYFEKPGHMKWVYEAPEEQVFLLNGTTVYLYQPNDKQLVIDEFEKIIISDLPVSFIMGIGDLSGEFKLVGACSNGDGIVLTLRPKRAKGELKELRLLVSPSNYLTLGGKVLDDSGNVTSVVFKNPKTNEVFSKDTFAPAFPKGIDVTDRRKEHEQ